MQPIVSQLLLARPREGCARNESGRDIEWMLTAHALALLTNDVVKAVEQLKAEV